jgi:hypothetical protein
MRSKSAGIQLGVLSKYLGDTVFDIDGLKPNLLKYYLLFSNTTCFNPSGTLLLKIFSESTRILFFNDTKSTLLQFFFRLYESTCPYSGSGFITNDSIDISTFQLDSNITREEFYSRYNSSKLLESEDIFPKISFRSGYPTFFRSLRFMYSDMNDLYFIRQYHLTRYLYRYRGVSSTDRLRLSILTLRGLLCQVHFVSTQVEADTLVLAGLILVNGSVVKNPNFILQCGDFIQLSLSYAAYFYLFKVLADRVNLLRSFYSKFSKLISISTLVDTDFDISNSTKLLASLRLSNLYKFYNLLYGTPSFVELDYLTCSFVIIFDPSLSSNYLYFIEATRSAFSYIKMLN